MLPAYLPVAKPRRNGCPKFSLALQRHLPPEFIAERQGPSTGPPHCMKTNRLATRGCVKESGPRREGRGAEGQKYGGWKQR